MKKHCGANSTMLDMGCGTGRLFPYFTDYVKEIVGVEPDEPHVIKSQTRIHDLDIEDKVVLKHMSFEEYRLSSPQPNSFDVILCSHIFQHIHTGYLPKLINDLTNLLKKDGLLIVLTCHSQHSYDYFTQCYFGNDNKSVVEEHITEKEFNTVILEHKNVLPHRFFSRKSLVKLLGKGIKIIDVKMFHAIGKGLNIFDNFFLRDKIVNFSYLLQTLYGRDMMLVIKKTK